MQHAKPLSHDDIVASLRGMLWETVKLRESLGRNRVSLAFLNQAVGLLLALMVIDPDSRHIQLYAKFPEDFQSRRTKEKGTYRRAGKSLDKSEMAPTERLGTN